LGAEREPILYQRLTLYSRDYLMEAERRRRPAAAIEVAGPGSCSGCGHVLDVAHRTGVRVVDIAQVKTGWLLNGMVHQSYCPACGQAYTYLIRYIPIECEEFACSRCGPGSKLATDILSISESETDYSFVALLKCNKCSTRQRFAKLLQPFSKITRLKIGPTGVEVEVQP
jgi:hypothetical protein